jgi:hypothetical protein
MDFCNFWLCAHNSKLASKGEINGIRIDSDFSTGKDALLPTMEYLTLEHIV